MQPHFTVRGGDATDAPVLAAAVHAGHDLRPEVAACIALDDDARRREEDPWTDRIAAAPVTTFVVSRSRFEVDVNRPRERAVYREPDDAWGLQVWRERLPDDVVERSRRLYDEFYAALGHALDAFDRAGPFVVLDVHSYNHRRGDGREAGPLDENPEINLGTGSVDRRRWAGVVERFMDDMARVEINGHRLDVRENVRFRGGHLADWVNTRYPDTGCALAIECKKTFMDEWTGEVDLAHVDALGAALAGTVPGLVAALEDAA
jgi:N-formylglutamate amidohydrolase